MEVVHPANPPRINLGVDDLTVTAAARQLFVSQATVKTHVNRILAKTGTRDRTQAAAYAHRRGLAGR